MPKTDYMLPMDDPKAIDDFQKLIRDIVQQELKKARFNRMLPAKVISVGSGTADIQFLSDGTPTTITGVKDKTGVTLNVNDEVYVEFINNSSSNIYIAIKK
jgi:hypothetical protein